MPGQPLASSPAELRHRLSRAAAVDLSEDGRITLRSDRQRLTLNRPTQGQAVVLRALARPGATERELCSLIAEADGAAAVPWVYLLLIQAGRRELIEASLTSDAGDFVSLQPFSPNYQLGVRSLGEDQPVQLCRFAYIRAVDGALKLESPRAHARVLLHDSRAAALLASLAAPLLPAEVGVAAGVDLPANIIRQFLTLLVQYDFLDVADTGGASTSSEAEARAQWEFHDLLFHGRSRSGRHLYPWGATYRWEHVHTPLPAVKEMEGEAISLFRPDLAVLEKEDPSFTAVLERRRSRRIPGPTPLSLHQLGEFLFRSSRVRGRTRTEHEEVSNRPYPGGGADYELEIYPVVQRVDGIASGIYYYHPLEHALYLIAESGKESAALLRDAAQKTRLNAFPDVLLCVTARFQRLTYKYSSIAYAVMLKDLGCLYQTFYLTATAMNLAPCAIGSGDSDLFAHASGLSFIVEPSVGEFMLSTPNDEDGSAPRLPGLPG